MLQIMWMISQAYKINDSIDKYSSFIIESWLKCFIDGKTITWNIDAIRFDGMTLWLNIYGEL